MGFILAGNLSLSCHDGGPAFSCLAINDNDQLTESVQKFWEAETVPEAPNANDSCCEDHFMQTTARGNDGNFIVLVPLSHNVGKLGDSYSTTESRFLALERRFKRDPSLKHECTRFINECIQLGHVSIISDLNTCFRSTNA